MKGNHDNPKRGMEFSYKGETLYLYIVKPGGIYLMCDDKSFGLDANYLELHKSVLEPLKSPQKQISKISDKQAKLNVAYSTLRKQFLINNKYCAGNLQGCTHVATTVHHPQGRMGQLLLDDSQFVPMCLSCHEWVESHPIQAKELGLSKSRLNKQP